jgi:hypothetical protein
MPMISTAPEVTLLGIVTLVRPLQLENAESPMFVTLSEIVKPVTPLFSNAPGAMAVTGSH